MAAIVWTAEMQQFLDDNRGMAVKFLAKKLGVSEGTIYRRIQAKPNYLIQKEKIERERPKAEYSNRGNWSLTYGC